MIVIVWHCMIDHLSLCSVAHLFMVCHGMPLNDCLIVVCHGMAPSELETDDRFSGVRARQSARFRPTRWWFSPWSIGASADQTMRRFRKNPSFFGRDLVLKCEDQPRRHFACNPNGYDLTVILRWLYIYIYLNLFAMLLSLSCTIILVVVICCCGWCISVIRPRASRRCGWLANWLVVKSDLSKTELGAPPWQSHRNWIIVKTCATSCNQSQIWGLDS